MNQIVLIGNCRPPPTLGLLMDRQGDIPLTRPSPPRRFGRRGALPASSHQHSNRPRGPRGATAPPSAGYLMHRTVRENLDTFLTHYFDAGDFTSSIPCRVQAALAATCAAESWPMASPGATAPVVGRTTWWRSLTMAGTSDLDSATGHTLDAPDHAGGWSVNASVMIPAWARHGLERLVSFCARPPLAK